MHASRTTHLLTKLSATVLLLCTAAAGPAVAETVLPPGENAYDYCELCHGTAGRGNRSINAPRIGGMEAWYIERQLVAFRRGWRGVHAEDYHGGEMRPMAMELTEAQLPEVAERFAAEPVADTPDTVDGDAARGEALYASCATCHGADGTGDEALGAPALRRQSDWYLVRQLQHYRNGVRGANPADARGAQMRAMTAVLADDAAIRDVVEYIGTFD